MIMVTGTVELKDGARDEMVEAVEAMLAATRQEDGCVDCRYAFDLEDPTRMTFHEVWSSPDAAKAHGDTPHMATFGRTMMGLVAGPPQATMWEASQL